MQITAPLLEQGKHILKAVGIVLTLVPPIRAVAVFITTRVIKDIGATATEDVPRAPELEVTVGVKTALVATRALVAVKEATLLAEPRVPTLAPILVIEAQFLLIEVLISATC